METTLENYCDLSVALKVQSLHTHYNGDEMHYWLAKVGEVGNGLSSRNKANSQDGGSTPNSPITNLTGSDKITGEKSVSSADEALRCVLTFC